MICFLVHSQSPRFIRAQPNHAPSRGWCCNHKPWLFFPAAQCCSWVTKSAYDHGSTFFFINGIKAEKAFWCTSLKKICDDVILIPDAPHYIAPILTAIPLQLLSYHIAAHLGCDVDKPRNLAKSVTVE